MSISSINNNQLASLATNSSQDTVATTGSTDASNETQSSDNTPTSSTQVTLSSDGQALANLASAGITFTQGKLSAADIADLKSGNLTKLEQDLGGSQHKNGEISQSTFNTLARQLGATQAQADQLFKGFDTNNDGSISNAELLKGLAQTSGSSSSSFSQALLHLIDSDGSGSVSGSEFLQFETKMVGIESPPSA